MLSSLLVSVLAAAGLPNITEPGEASSILSRDFSQEALAAADTSTGAVSGRVRSEINGSVLEHAVVEIVAQGRVLSVLTDRYGRYQIANVPAGSRLVRARALDHSELSIGVRVPPGEEVLLDLSLAVEPIEMEPLSAETTREEPPEPTPVTAPARERGEISPAEAELQMLESTPGVAELGLVQLIQAASSPDPEDPSSILYVRGATSDLKLVLLDGAPVYAPFHLGGLIEAFRPGALEHSRAYIGGAPARYSGGLSYILDMGSRPGRSDRFHTAGAVDMMSARGDVEGALPGGSFLVGGRYIHGEGPDRLTGTELPYAYGDALLRMDWGVGREGQLSVTGFYNRESVDLARSDDPESGELQANEPGLAPELRFGELASWGNLAGSIRYLGRALDSDLELTAAHGKFSTSLPLGGRVPLVVDGRSDRTRLAGILSRNISSAQVEIGASFDRVALVHEAGPAIDRTERSLSSHNAGESVGAHAEATMRVLPTVFVRGGVRADYFFADGMKIAPRVSVAWSFIDETELSFAAGRYHQRVLAPETLFAAELGSLAGVASGDPDLESETQPGESALRVSSSTHLVFGINSRALQNFVVGLEGYVKSFQDLPVGPDIETSGLDFFLQRSAGEVSGWVGYSVAWYRPEYEGRQAVARSLGRQLFTGGVSAHLLSGFGVDVSLAYGVALPFTPIPQADDGGGGGISGPGGGNSPQLSVEPAYAVGPTPASDLGDATPWAGAARGTYLRLDGTIYRTWVLNVNGIPISISPYLRILNALDRRDGLFFQFDPDQDRRPVSLGAVPLIPLIGVRWGL